MIPSPATTHPLFNVNAALAQQAAPEGVREKDNPAPTLSRELSSDPPRPLLRVSLNQQ